MFKMKIEIVAPEDIQYAQTNFMQKLANSSLAGPQADLLSEQVKTTLDQFGKQLKRKSEGHTNLDRLLEGDGYRIKVSVRSNRQSLIKRLADAIGLKRDL